MNKKKIVVTSVGGDFSIEKGYVYLIRNNSFEYKIGMTKQNVNKRLKQLQTGNSQDLLLVKFLLVENYKKVEKSLHNHFSNKRINREWFNLNKKDVKKFEMFAKTYENSIKVFNSNSELLDLNFYI